MNITKLKDKILSRAFFRGVIAISIFLIIWEVGARFESWYGYRVPWIGLIPAPTAVFESWVAY